MDKKNLMILKLKNTNNIKIKFFSFFELEKFPPEIFYS